MSFTPDSSFGSGNARDSGSRRLTDDVFPSAQEDLLAHQAAPYEDLQARPVHVYSPHAGQGRLQRLKSSLEEKVEAQVAERPMQAALLAAAVGALAVAGARLLLQRSRPTLARRRFGLRW
jgi:hypothetical protein